MLRRFSVLLIVFIIAILTGIHSGAGQVPLSSDQINSAISQGVNWLEANQNGDGSWGNSVPRRDTPLAIQALSKAATDTTSILAARNWLATTDSPNADYLARKIVAQTIDEMTDTQNLLSQQQVDGGFGLSPFYASGPLDTALALEAIIHIDGVDTQKLIAAAGFLANSHNDDGGWSLLIDGPSDIQTTAWVIRALDSFRKNQPALDPTLDAILVDASNWLALQQNPSGSWGQPGSIRATALALQALSAGNNVSFNRDAAIAFLVDNQAPDGSWNNEPFETALALLTLDVGSLNIATGSSDMSASSQVVNAGTPITITARIHNMGDLPIPESTVRFYLGDPASGGIQLTDKIVTDLSEGQSQAIQYIFSTTGKFGSYRIFAVADPDGLLGESNRADNVGSIDIEVRSVPTKPMPMSPEDSAFLRTSPTQFSWHNAADQSGFPLTYEIQIDNTPTFSSAEKMIFYMPEQPWLTYFTLPATLTDGIWYWRVAANNGQTTGSFSEARSFTLDTRPLTITNISANPNPFSAAIWSLGTTISYTLDDTASVNIDIADQSGNIVRHLPGSPGKVGSNQAVWDGKNDLLQPVPDGTYGFLITASNLTGNESTTSGEVTVDSSAPEITELDVSPPKFSPNEDGVADSAGITYRLSEASTVSIRVYKDTQLVRVLAENVHKSSDFHGQPWDGKDTAGAYVADGSYNVAVSAVDSVGNAAIERNVLVQVDKTFGTIGSVSMSPNPSLPGGQVLLAVPISGAVTGATATINGVDLRLTDSSTDTIYTTTITAPADLGNYPITVRASNALGQSLEVSNQSLQVVSEFPLTQSITQTSLADFYVGGYSTQDLDLHTSPGDLLLAKKPWEFRNPMPTERSAFGIAEKDGKIYVAGGKYRPSWVDPWVDPDEPSSRLEIYDTATDQWQVGPSMPTPRAYASAALGVDGKIYVFGGS